MILGKTMTLPRSHDRKDMTQSSAVKDSVATYILHKFAALGYLAAVQKFTPKHFTHAVSKFVKCHVSFKVGFTF